MISCPHCQQTENQVKVGFNASGSQRYKCHNCNRKYTPNPKENGYPQEIRLQAVQMYVDGMNYRRIGRTLGVNHQSVINWVNAHVAQLPDDPPLPDSPLEVAELDELFTFVGAKKTKRSS
jgi:transposase-like protein